MRICVALLVIGVAGAAGWLVRYGPTALADQPAVALPAATPAVAQAPKGGDPADATAIQKNAEAFIEAFQGGNAKSVAAFWAPDGEHIDLSGRRLKGRDDIEKALHDLFTENKGRRCESRASSPVPDPDVAIEEGISFVLRPDGPHRLYTNVHVKGRGGSWARDEHAYVPPATRTPPRAEWAIGNRASENEKGEAEHLQIS